MYLQYNVMKYLLIAPQTTYNEKHWEPHQNQAMAEAVGEVAEFESTHDLSKLVSHTCSEIRMCTHYGHKLFIMHRSSTACGVAWFVSIPVQ